MLDPWREPSMTQAGAPSPTEIRLDRAAGRLYVAFDDGNRFSFTQEFLRVESPSADVQGHTPDQRKFVGGKSEVTISRIEPVGHYAVRLVFDDGHDTGIYSWDYMLALGRQQEARWATYLSGLAATGQTREAPRR